MKVFLKVMFIAVSLINTVYAQALGIKTSNETIAQSNDNCSGGAGC